jgi:uncharacterized membrane protein
VKVAPITAEAAIASRVAAPVGEGKSTAMSLKVYPNPAPDKVNVSFTVDKSQAVQVKVYDSQGTVVATLLHAEVQAGKPYSLKWQPAAKQAAGIYIIHMQTADQVKQQKVVLTR